MTVWRVKNKKYLPGAVNDICRRFKVTPLGAEIMLARELKSQDMIDFYKNADISRLHPIKNIPQVQQAFSVILSAIEKNLPIVIYGDYDVDGITSTVILCKGLRALGADVTYFIPDRHTDGYGLNPSAVKKIAEQGCKLLITCDNGIASKSEIAYAKELGVATVILDHHEPPFKIQNNEKKYILPGAEATVDLKIEEIDYPFRELCAGGLCYKFIRELFEYLNKEFYLDEELNVLASIATVCDVVPLLDENRILVKRGLEIINGSVPNKGLDTLVGINELRDKRITEYTYGFIIGPCINAVGRLEVATLGAELFMCEDNERCMEIAEHLFNLNIKRKEMTKESVERLTQIAENTEDRVLVLYDEAVDESIAGIVAGRLREVFNKPAIVLTKSEGGAKGSARSIEKYDLFKELSCFKELFTKFGGHKMAAGMSLPVENIEPLRRVLNENCRLTAEDMERVYTADAVVEMNEISLNAAEDMEIFKPFGTANPEPLIGAVNLSISSLRFVGEEKNIASFSVTDSSCNYVSAVWFNGENLPELINDFYGYEVIDADKNIKIKLTDLRIDIISALCVDEYNGNKKPKLIIKDLRISK